MYNNRKMTDEERMTLLQEYSYAFKLFSRKENSIFSCRKKLFLYRKISFSPLENTVSNVFMGSEQVGDWTRIPQSIAKAYFDNKLREACLNSARQKTHEELDRLVEKTCEFNLNGKKRSCFKKIGVIMC